MPAPIKGTISASRGAAILGLNKFQTPFDVCQDLMEELNPGFNERRGYVYEPFTGNASTRWGHAFEDAIIELAEEKAGKKIIAREQVFTHNYSSKRYIQGGHWILSPLSLSCHIDGLYDDWCSNPWTLHEGKTTTEQSFRRSWGEPGTARVPRPYQVQCQHQMICTGAEEVILSVLVFPKSPEEWEGMGWLTSPPDDMTGAGWWVCKPPGEGFDIGIPEIWAKTLAQMGFFHQYRIPANREAQEALKKHYANFCGNYVIPGNPPPAESFNDIKRMFPEPVGEIIATPEIEELIAEYKSITKETGASSPAAKRKKDLKIAITEYMMKSPAYVPDESQEKAVLLSGDGKRLASYNGKVFR